MPLLTLNQKRRAEQMLADGRTISVIAGTIGCSFEAAVLALFGDGAARDPATNTPRGESGTAREASGGQPFSDIGDIGGLKQGAQPATRPLPAPAPPQPQERRYRLTNERGDYLDKSGKGMTRAVTRAWSGTNAQLEEVLRRHPHLKNLDVEACP